MYFTLSSALLSTASIYDCIAHRVGVAMHACMCARVCVHVLVCVYTEINESESYTNVPHLKP